MIPMLPNVLTLLNLFCGCLGIVFAFTDRPIFAIGSVGLCLLFDFLDGLMARALNQQHPLGADLDSLADVVSFGVLPGVMYFQMLSGLSISESLPLLIYTGFIFTLFGAYRLARFNVVQRDSGHFTGLPIPSAAIFVSGLYLIDHSGNCESCSSAFINPPVLLLSIMLLSFLMVSSLPHFSFKIKKLSWKGLEIQWIYLVLVVVLAVLLREVAVSLAIVLYIFLSLAYFSFRPNRFS
ncbi:MAG: CDP-diacylglycerol--serine O-phosphatidyltransferase [Saprospiraceae bacterium]|nr:CDP-diacylglycerol--serine O-phosphatidyltransferase [Saprospiraceae bacterium]